MGAHMKGDKHTVTRPQTENIDRNLKNREK